MKATAIYIRNTGIQFTYDPDESRASTRQLTLLLEGLGYGFSSSRMQRGARVQPAIYGVGQMVFAIGFGFAGAHGMARKAYGHEQQARSAAETAGMVVMGLGGLVAIAGGLLFLTIVIAAWRARRRADVERDHPTWRLPWSKSVASIHSKS